MKYYITLLFICITVKLIHAQNSKIIQLPISIKTGYGPFDGPSASIGADDTNNVQNSWHTTYMRVKGFPKHWKNYFYGSFHTDFYQWTYQNYKEGKISPEDFLSLQKSWQWIPNENKLSATPIKCYVHCGWNIDENGHMGEMVLDANNNLDFSDDTVFTAPGKKGLNNDELARTPRYFQAEKYTNGKIEPIRLRVIFNVDPPHINYSIPQYGTAGLAINGRNYKIGIAGDFVRADFSYSKISLINNEAKKISKGSLISENEYLTIDKKIYKHKGVDYEYLMLLLEEVSTSERLYSSQIGYHAFPFIDTNLISGEEISLEKYKGKYVFIDFWGTWCKPCVEEVPNVKKAYKTLDNSKIAFISSAYDSPKRLKEFINKEDMGWPQIVYTSESEGVLKLYNITSYPTTLLIDPSGKIIAKNLRGEDLTSKISALMK